MHILADRRVGRIVFVLLVLAMLGVTALTMMGVSGNDKDLVRAIAPVLILGGMGMTALRMRDMGWHWFFAVPALLPRTVWLYGLTRYSFFRNDAWENTILVLLLVDVLLLLALSIWPGRHRPGG